MSRPWDQLHTQWGASVVTSPAQWHLYLPGSYSILILSKLARHPCAADGDTHSGLDTIQLLSENLNLSKAAFFFFFGGGVSMFINQGEAVTNAEGFFCLQILISGNFFFFWFYFEQLLKPFQDESLPHQMAAVSFVLGWGLFSWYRAFTWCFPYNVF